MKNKGLLTTVSASLALSLASFANAIPITFDDLDATAADISLGSYAAFTWSNFLGYTSLEGFPGFNNGIISTANAAYGGGELAGAPATPIVSTLSSSSAFNFVSAYLGAGYYDNLSLLIEGRQGDAVLFSQSVVLNTTGAQLFNFNFLNIDSLWFSAYSTTVTTDPFQCGTFNCTHFTIDSLEYDPATPTASVPEPASFGLLAMGLIGMAIRRRKLLSSSD